MRRFLIIACICFSVAVLTILPSYAEEGNFFDYWSGRYSISAYGIDNNRINDGYEVMQSNLLRLINDGELNSDAKYEIHLLNSFVLNSADTAQESSMFTLSQGDLKYRTVDLTWDLLDETTVSLFSSIDRLNVRYTLPKADITIGRQAITFGKSWFWNPLDIYLPFDAGSIDRDYKAGVDAIRIDVPTGDFSGFNVIVVGGQKQDYLNSINKADTFAMDWYGSSILLRGFTTIRGWDFAIQGGKIYGGNQIGGGFVGEVGDFQIRGEASYFIAENSPPVSYLPESPDLFEDHREFVLGIGRYYQNNMNIDIEYFYNGAAISDDLSNSWLRMISGASKHASKNLLGLNVTFQLHPLLSAQVASIVSLSDSSCLIQPFLIYSVTNDSDFLLGMGINFGESPITNEYTLIPQSEFGSYPNVIFAEYKYFF